MYSYGSPHTAAQKQDDQHERTFSSYVRIQVVVLKTYLGRWTIGRSGERGSGISVLPARYDDDDDDDYFMTDVDCADDIALLANTPTQAETLLHSLERTAAGINVHKTEYICFNQTGDISTLNGNSLKLVNKFTYLGSSVSSTETDIDKRPAKAWTAISHMEVRPGR